jgi:TolA-binding protein
MSQKFISKRLLLFVASATLLVAEPSVYGFNNLNSGTTQGLTSAEKMIIKNKKTIVSLKRKVAQQNERIDGLTSLIEGLSASIAALKEGGNLSSSTAGSSDNTALLKDLGKMIDKIDAEYVSKEELQKVLSEKNRYVSTTSKKDKPKQSESKNSLEKRPTVKLYGEGVRHFVKKRYDEAKKRFMITDAKGYKTAASNYYLGEIAYYTKQYENAIFYFKKSAGLYDQATYIDTLLLHTAVSLEKNGDRDQAKVFYENIIVNYSGKKSAKIAKQKLKKL